MEFLRATVGKIVGDFAKQQIRPVATALMLWTIAFLLALVMVGFVLAGIYSAIEAELGPIAAAFIMAGGSALVAIILVFAANWQLSRMQKPPKPEETPVAPDGGTTAANFGTMAASFAYGFVSGIGSRRRRRKSGE